MSLPPVADAAFPGATGGSLTTIGETTKTVSPLSVLPVTQSMIESVRPNGRGQRTLLGPFSLERRYFTGLAYSPGGRKLALSFGPYHRRSSLPPSSGRPRAAAAVDTVPARRARSQPGLGPGRSAAGVHPAVRQLGAVRVYRAGRSREILEQEADNLAWSVRRRIAFAYEPGGSAASEPSIYTVRPDGSRMRRIVESGGDPDWSPNGRWIVYTMPGWLDGLGPRRPGRASTRRASHWSARTAATGACSRITTEAGSPLSRPTANTSSSAGSTRRAIAPPSS